MDEITLSAILLVFTSLPGLGLGLALMTGKWNPASLQAAADPARARRATGRFLVAIGALLVLEPATAHAAAPWAVGGIVLASALLAIHVVRATRS